MVYLLRTGVEPNFHYDALILKQIEKCDTDIAPKEIIIGSQLQPNDDIIKIDSDDAISDNGTTSKKTIATLDNQQLSQFGRDCIGYTVVSDTQIASHFEHMRTANKHVSSSKPSFNRNMGLYQNSDGDLTMQIRSSDDERSQCDITYSDDELTIQSMHNTDSLQETSGSDSETSKALYNNIKNK